MTGDEVEMDRDGEKMDCAGTEWQVAVKKTVVAKGD